MRILIYLSLFISSLAFADHTQNPFCSMYRESTIAKMANIDVENEKDQEDLLNDIHNIKNTCGKYRLFSRKLISWPDMKVIASPKEINKSNSINTIVINGSILKIKLLDMKTIRDSYLAKGPNRKVTPVKYNNNTGMFYSKVFRIPEKYTLVHYWKEVENKIPLLINCVPHHSNTAYMMCNIMFAMPQLNAIIDITFQQEHLPQWKEMVQRIEQYILSNITTQI